MLQLHTLTGKVVIPIGLPINNVFALATNARSKTTKVPVDMNRNGWHATATTVMPLSAKKVLSTT